MNDFRTELRKRLLAEIEEIQEMYPNMTYDEIIDAMIEKIKLMK